MDETFDSTGIAVHGSGIVELPPDIAYLTVGVQVIVATVGAARPAAAMAANAVLDALKAGGIEPRDIQTTRLNIQPNIDYSKEGQPLTGYTISNTVVAKVRKLDTLSALVDSATEAGGDASRLQDIRFDVEDSAAAQRQARESAMADAKSKAEHLAALAGVTLGRVESIREVSTANARPEQMRAFKSVANDMSSTPVEAGTNAVRCEVAVRYAIG